MPYLAVSSSPARNNLGVYFMHYLPWWHDFLKYVLYSNGQDSRCIPGSAWLEASKDRKTRSSREDMLPA